MSRKKILVTGSNGLLGQKLSELILKNEDYQLIATGIGQNRLASIYPQLEYISLDICNKNQVNEVLDSVKPDYLINTAAMTQVDDCEVDKEKCIDLNVKSVEYLVSACERNHIHLIHLSTDFIFDGADGPYSEDDKPNPISYYGESKLQSEEIVRKSTCPWSIVRTVLVYGIVHQMSRSNIILWVKNSLEQRKSIRVVNDQWRTPTLAEDLAMGCFLICKNDAKGVYNISGPDLLTPYDMAIYTAEHFGLDKNLIEEVDGSVFTQTAKRPPKTGFILDKARRELAYKPHSFREGIQIVASQIEKG